jgi:hypothetical protein
LGVTRKKYFLHTTFDSGDRIQWNQTVSRAADMRKSRAHCRFKREVLGPALVEAGRLGEWDEQNVPAIDQAARRLLSDWIREVTCNGSDPVPTSMLATESTDEVSDAR